MDYEQENTLRALQGRPLLKGFTSSVLEYKEFVVTYREEDKFLEDGNVDTLIHDMLYGLGKSLSDEYGFATGYRKFKLRLLNMILEEQSNHDQLSNTD